jgi:outer membrane receptor protein involved in Fe transport
MSQAANPSLQPEVMYSAEVEYIHRITSTLSTTVSAWGNTVRNLIDIQGTGTQTDPMQFVNTTTPIAVVGTDLSITRDWRNGWMLGANYGWEHAVYLRGTTAEDLLALRGDPGRRNVANVPAQNLAFRVFAPILDRRLLLGTRWTLLDRRWDRNDRISDAPQTQTDAAVLWDIVLSGHEEHYGLSYYGGVYNLFNWHYTLPVGFEFNQRTMPQLGRSVVAGIGWQY